MDSKMIRRAAMLAAIAGSIAISRADSPSVSPTVSLGEIPTTSGVSVITQPSAQPKLKFAFAGIVRERLVNDGDAVKAGQVLLRQDTDIDQAELNHLKVEAFSDSRVEAAQADLEVKQIEYDRESKAADGAYSLSEVEETKAKKIEAEKSVRVAQEDKQEAKAKYDEQAVHLAKMELTSPIDGIVEHVVIDKGEMADPQDKDGAVVVVKNDPLWVEIRGLTTLQVSMVKLGQTLQVRYLNDGADQWKDGKIIYITPVADAGADRQLVRLELPNADGRAAGLRMDLKLPKNLEDAAPKDDNVLSRSN